LSVIRATTRDPCRSGCFNLLRRNPVGTLACLYLLSKYNSTCIYSTAVPIHLYALPAWRQEEKHGATRFVCFPFQLNFQHSLHLESPCRWITGPNLRTSDTARAVIGGNSMEPAGTIWLLHTRDSQSLTSKLYQLYGHQKYRTALGLFHRRPLSDPNL